VNCQPVRQQIQAHDNVPDDVRQNIAFKIDFVIRFEGGMSIITSPEAIVAGAEHISQTAHPHGVDVTTIHKAASIEDNHLESDASPANTGTDAIDRHIVLYLSFHACNYDIFIE
jgi:hypothetical protein